MAEEATETLAGRRVLVVEDEYLIADDLDQPLTAAGAEVIGPVPSLGEATRLTDEGRLDAAVLDINLRDVAAYPLIDRMMARALPVVLATGYDAAAIPERYRDLPRCEKPSDADAVTRKLAELF